MLRKKTWLAIAATALSGLCGSARAQEFVPVPMSGPVVQFVDNHQQPDHCRSGIMGGAAVYIVRPYINNNIAFTTITGIGGATPLVASQDFDWNYHVAPAAWLGWTSRCGVGGRARYFHFDQDAEPQSGGLTAAAAATTVIAPPQGLSPLVGVPPRGFQSPGILLQGGTGEDGLRTSSDLELQTIDGEATFAHEWRHFGLLLTVGGRYMESRQAYHATLVNIPVAGTSENSFLDANHNFHGGGPTVSCMGRWEIGRSGLAVFGSARGSFVIGGLRTSAVFTENIVDPVNGDQSNVATTQAEEDIVVPIGEIEGGLEYSRALGRSRLFFRGGAVNHTYFDLGSSSSRDGSVSLFGAQVSVGLSY